MGSRGYNFGKSRNAFIITIDTTKLSTGSSANNQFKLPLLSAGTYNMLVNWGDGNSDTITAYNQAAVTHTYASTGVYTIKITGVLKRWQFANGGDCKKLITIEKWGCWEHATGAVGASNFYGCSNLTAINDTKINWTGFQDASDMFNGCSGLTSFPAIDFTGIVQFARTWSGCTGLTSFPNCNFPTSSGFVQTWINCTGLTSFLTTNFPNCSNFTSTWEGCTGLTSFPLITYKNATGTFNRTWFGCTGLTSFPLINFSTITAMQRTWQGCLNINNFPAIDVSNVTDFTFTWYQNASSTNFPLLNLNKLSAGISTFQLAYPIPTAVYTQLLINLSAGNVNNTVTFHAGTSKYNSTASAARANLVSRGWTITDGGLI